MTVSFSWRMRPSIAHGIVRGSHQCRSLLLQQQHQQHLHHYVQDRMIHHRTPVTTSGSSNGRDKSGNNNGNGNGSNAASSSSSSSSWRLPLHHASSPSAVAAAATKAKTSASSSSPSATGSSSSSNFLMGGSYYPGKHKAATTTRRLLNRKRRHGTGGGGAISSIGLAVFHCILSPIQRLLNVISPHSPSRRHDSFSKQQHQHRRKVGLAAIFLLGMVMLFFSTSSSSTTRRRQRRHWAEQLPIVRSIVKGKHAWWWKSDIIDQLQRNELSMDLDSTAGEKTTGGSSTTTPVIHLPTRRQALAMAEELQLQRQRLDSQQQQAPAQQQQQQHDNSNKPLSRLELLEKIVPAWYHRNDPKKTTTMKLPLTNNVQDKPPSSPVATTEAPQQRVLGATKAGDVTTHQQGYDTKKEPSISPLLESTDTTATPTRIVRTLHTMDWENVTRHNHCPSTMTTADDGDHDNIRITLVTQSSLDRAWILDETCLRWNTDPIIAVIALNPLASNHTSNDQSASTVNDEKERMTNIISILSSGWQMKCPHLTIIPYTLSPLEAMPANYPVNQLRNLALDAVQTSHVLVVDVDFVPSRDLAHDIRQAILLRRRVRRQQRQEQQQQSATTTGAAAAVNTAVVDSYNAEEYDALVVPAFERVLNVPCATVGDCKGHLRHNHSFIPNTFDELRACVKEENCQVFQSSNNWEGHYSTRSQRWLAQDWYENIQNVAVADNTTATLHDVKSIPCFDSLRYEPYVVIRWCPGSSLSSSSLQAQSNSTNVRPVAPYYDERFHGYGKNKIEFIAHLRIAYYQFAILPRGFIVHNPHVESKSKQAWNNVSSTAGGAAGNANLHMDMDRLYPVFLKELIQKYHPVQNNNSGNTTNRRLGRPEHIVDSCQ